MHHHRQQQAHGISDDVSLSTVDHHTSIIATRPPFSVVFTLRLSDGRCAGTVGTLIVCGRSNAGAWRRGLTRSHVSPMVQLRKYLYRVCRGRQYRAGSTARSSRSRSKYRMPFSYLMQVTTVRGRPPGLAGGSRGPRISHCSSVRSLLLRFAAQPCRVSICSRLCKHPLRLLQGCVGKNTAQSTVTAWSHDGMTTRFNSTGFSGLLIPVLAVLIVLLGCGFKIEKATSDPPFVKPANPG